MPVIFSLKKDSPNMFQSKDGTATNTENEIPFKVLNSRDLRSEGLDYEGHVVYKKRWMDRNGKNVVLFTRNRDELFVFHYVTINNNTKRLRRVYDFEKDCEDDLTITFIEESIKVTDLDNDNLGEITFAYKKTCSTDVSPMTLKLLTLENGEKYIIRGTTKPKYIDSGGDKNIDQSFYKAPSSFLKNANHVWGNIVNQ
jgi:hypothetical protein